MGLGRSVGGVEIPITSLAPDTLTRVIEEFVLREGTEYGPGDFSLADKVAQVRSQLERGRARLLYDEKSESCTIEPVQRGGQ